MPGLVASRQKALNIFMHSAGIQRLQVELLTLSTTVPPEGKLLATLRAGTFEKTQAAAPHQPSPGKTHPPRLPSTSDSPWRFTWTQPPYRPSA
jgi:hypothetical protein